jgi:Holliday junction resolvasome RuvABC endonuclease subunit
MTRTVLGFDPGPTTHGYALLRVDSGRPVYLACGEVAAKDHAAILALIEQADLVAVETPRGIPYGKDMGKVRGRSRDLLATGIEAGRLLGMSSCYEVEMEQASAEDWRKAIVGKGGAADWQVKIQTRSRILGWPLRSSVHARDAAGMALYAHERARLLAAGVPA